MNGPGGGVTLTEVVERAQRVGLVGRRADPDAEIARCEAFVEALEGRPDLGLVVDLGSGNGLPGLVVALRLPVHVVLVEVGASRCDFLRWAAAALEMGERVEVAEGAAEDLARGEWRGRADAVVARSFGPPATTAECAVGFLRSGGVIVVAEPPGAPAQRWPADGLARLSLLDEGVTAGGVRILRLEGQTPGKWPRRSPRPRRDPVF